MNIDRLYFRRIANIINKDSRITLGQNLVPVVHKTGYYVSLIGVKRELPNRCEPYDVSIASSHDVEICLQELGNKIGLLALTGYVGFWKDDINLYADYTINIRCKLIAICVGLVCKQKAIYDCEKKEVINL